MPIEDSPAIYDRISDILDVRPIARVEGEIELPVGEIRAGEGARPRAAGP